MSEPPSGTSTPRSFTNQSTTAEDLLKNQTVGLVHLSEFRKRRADALEQKEKEAQDKAYGRFKPSTSVTATPDAGDSDGALTPLTSSTGQPPKKKKKKAVKGLLSFGDDEEDGTIAAHTRDAWTPQDPTDSANETEVSKSGHKPISRRLTPNPNTSLPAPKVLTKASLQAEVIARDNLRREFLAIQEAVKNVEIAMPFVFYDGTNIPGGVVKVKKGDHVWLFLERCRKVGAELGVSGGGSGSSNGLLPSKNDNRKAWARVGVDDLMCVRGDVIVPHHYEFYYFIANRIPNPSKTGGVLFDYSNTADTKKEADEALLLRRPNDEQLEGQDHDPALTKVVDRRWYEKNKHIYPATLWKEFEVGKEFEEKMSKMRRDGQEGAICTSGKAVAKESGKLQ